MAETYWTERKGDTVIVHTQYVSCVARFTDCKASTQRGGEFVSADKSVEAYCVALEAKGYVRRKA